MKFWLEENFSTFEPEEYGLILHLIHENDNDFIKTIEPFYGNLNEVIK